MNTNSNSSSSGWQRVNKSRPCPVCSNDHACKISTDGAAAMCKRVRDGCFKETKGGWYLHRLKERGEAEHSSGYLGAAHRKPKAIPNVKLFKTAEAAIEFAGRRVEGGELVKVWTYHDAAGDEVMKVARFNKPDGGKEFRPVYHNKLGWLIGDPPGALPLFRLPDLREEGGTIYVCEGEKAADAAVSIELSATTSAHGAESAEKTDWKPLAGRDVIILPDADEAGAKYARMAATILVGLSPPTRVKIVPLPGLPRGGDIVEFTEAQRSTGKTNSDIRGEIEALAAAASFVNASDMIGGPVVTCLADIQPKEISWLWPGRMPLGRITLLVGRPGEGKSFLTTDMASRVSTGTPWPDGEKCPQGEIVIVSAEDDPAEVIRPRLDAHHADCTKVHSLSAVRRIDTQGQASERMFTLEDVPALETVLLAHPACKLVVIDPIGSFLGGKTDAHRDNEVRSVLAPIARLAVKHGAAILIVAHRRKSQSEHADDLALGSRAFTGIARAVWHLSHDPENKNRKLLLAGKNNLAPEGTGLAFSIGGKPPCISWERDPIEMNANDGLAAEQSESEKPGPGTEKRDAAKEWLRERLSAGPAPVGDAKEPAPNTLRADVKEAGLSWSTIRRAGDDLGVISEKCPFSGKYQWRLPKLVAQAP